MFKTCINFIDIRFRMSTAFFTHMVGFRTNGRFFPFPVGFSLRGVLNSLDFWSFATTRVTFLPPS